MSRRVSRPLDLKNVPPCHPTLPGLDRAKKVRSGPLSYFSSTLPSVEGCDDGRRDKKGTGRDP